MSIEQHSRLFVDFLSAILYLKCYYMYTHMSNSGKAIKVYIGFCVRPSVRLYSSAVYALLSK
jgi:hypothetical protein